jgi:hypothetical protein
MSMMVLRDLLHRSRFREVDTDDEHVGRKFGSSGRLNHRFVSIAGRVWARAEEALVDAIADRRPP